MVDDRMVFDEAERFLEPAAEIVGVSSGAALGAAAGGPIGAILGAGAGAALEHGLKGFIHRQLSRREQARIGAAYTYATRAFKERLENDDIVRDDQLLKKRKHGRSDWDEIVEGVLIVSQRQFEERKVEHLGYLLANIAFTPEVGGYLANWAL